MSIKAPKVITFAKALEELCTIGGVSAKNFVKSLPHERWANEYFEVIQKIEKQMYDYIDPYYTIEAFKLSYEGTINQIPSLGASVVTKESAIILPPKTRRPRGRPKVGRIRSRGEKVRQMECGRCGKLEKHNRRTCKEAID
ncbi:hypothetical protein RHMOL_Rhmol02G0205300 [Rhododendron molle]|uniref:Uncharacterized protein n=1 Tax=Rhododendron molle TaxID=49168 RepID=A0ACC0PTN5_RHOML|nr:hypothetical protein RHMOL_Rhmol02G0205300 [Rhododendron molle]